jgi:glycosyltransferase involved in cell wall biosynthesis
MTRIRQHGHGHIAFVGNYLPRKCGIATFTYDLAEAVARQAGEDQPVIVVAMNDTPEGYPYPNRVKFEVRQGYQIDYARAADFLNFGHIDAVSLQHEYGIYGGEWGSNLLTLLRDLQRPFIVTCHTVLRDVHPTQKEVFDEIANRASRLVVMSDLAAAMLKDVYKVPHDKIALIPHGIHDVPFIDPSFYKDKFGVEGRTLLLTFGLLHRNKGVEYMIDALPAIVEKHPKVTYLVLGATHPHVFDQEGESYRLGLQRQVRNLGLEDNVLFHPRFVELDELLEYLGAADICVTPYLNLDQITSGVLSYAMGSGKAVVSTPYWHAKEMLADGRGRLVPLHDSEALTREINALLDDEVVMSTVRKKAYMYTRPMVWHNVAKDYMRLFDEVRSHVPTFIPSGSSLRQHLSPASLPTPRLDHLSELCDDTGPAHHARYSVPIWSYGYHLDDAASTLVASTKFHNVFGSRDAARIAGVCMGLIQILIDSSSGRRAARLSYVREPAEQASDASTGKALWALGYVVSRSRLPHSALANDLFQELASAWVPETIMGHAYAILGAANYLVRFSGASDVRRTLVNSATELAGACEPDAAVPQWKSADWPVAAQAISVAGQALEKSSLTTLAERMFDEMRRETIGCTLFLKRGENPDEEEIPLTAASCIEALGAAYKADRSKDVLQLMRNAADWFLGANSIGTPVYDFETGGCYDALTATSLNRNQGTEATTFCMLAFLTLTRIAGLGELNTASDQAL